MPAGPADVLRQALDAFNRGGPPAMFDLADPDIEVYLPENPDRQLWRGRDEAATVVAEWSGSFDDFEIVLEEVTEVGDRAFAVLLQRGRSKLAGGRVEGRIAYIVTVQDGLVTRWEILADIPAARAELERP